MTLEEALKQGQIAVIPTDTIYGVVGSALIPDTVEKIYHLRKRKLDKPFIILISDLNDLNHFNVKLTDQAKEILQKVWPGPVSVILNLFQDPEQKLEYLHRGTNSLAFRMPKDEKLLDLVKETGPLVAPSANPEGEKPAETIEEAKDYFGNQVDFYLDGGQIQGKSSKLVKIEDGQIVVLRA